MEPEGSPPDNAQKFLGRRLLGSYEIVDVLGAGATGAVFLARQDRIEQEIAIKVLHGDAAGDPEVQERFNREARVISMLSHPNIIRVLVFGLTPDGESYMAMEYVHGRSLRDELARGPLDELTVIKITKQLLSALAEAHDLGIVHRDLKPENVLLTSFRGEENFVKVLDFGIAKILEPDSPQKQLTQAGIVYGTPEYISPEQAQAIDIDNRTDIYAIGCMLYEMLTGAVPFEAKSALKTLQMQAFESPRPMAEHGVDVSEDIEAITLKAMEKAPEDRYQSALEMFYALERRERALLRERSLSERAGWIPGAEITGMFTLMRENPGKLMKDPDLKPLLVANLALLGFLCLLLAIVTVAVIV